jgi:hypothetical protein
LSFIILLFLVAVARESSSHFCFFILAAEAVSPLGAMVV